MTSATAAPAVPMLFPLSQEGAGTRVAETVPANTTINWGWLPAPSVGIVDESDALDGGIDNHLFERTA